MDTHYTLFYLFISLKKNAKHLYSDVFEFTSILKTEAVQIVKKIHQ